jgi:hypothetical protein
LALGLRVTADLICTPEHARMGNHSISPDEARPILTRALRAIVVGDDVAIDLFTDDVVGDSPNMCVRSRSELEYQLLDRRGALSGVEFVLERVERGESGLVATWRMSGDHTGEVMFNEDEFFEPTGRRICLSATTVVQFRANRICAFRTSYEDEDLFDQIRRESPEAP